MDRKEFDKMELLEQVQYFNNLLAEGKTIRDIAEGIGIARSTIRDRFKKIGYKYNKKNNIYTKNTDITKISNNNNIKINIDDDIKELIKHKDILLELAADYKNRTATEININDIPAELKAGVVIKSIKVYTDIAGKFEKICNRYKGIKKQDLYSLALLEFTEKYSE